MPVVPVVNPISLLADPPKVNQSNDVKGISNKQFVDSLTFFESVSDVAHTTKLKFDLSGYTGTGTRTLKIPDNGAVGSSVMLSTNQATILQASSITTAVTVPDKTLAFTITTQAASAACAVATVSEGATQSFTVNCGTTTFGAFLPRIFATIRAYAGTGVPKLSISAVTAGPPNSFVCNVQNVGVFAALNAALTIDFLIIP